MTMPAGARMSMVIAGCIAAAIGPALSAEIDHQRRLCDGMQQNRYVQSTRTFVDCVSDTHAFEVDFTGSWAEAIGQALAYGEQLGLRPGIILVCHERSTMETCIRHGYIVEQTIAGLGLGLTLWRCEADAKALSDCRATEFERPE